MVTFVRVTDEDYDIDHVLLKNANGALCTVTGLFQRPRGKLNYGTSVLLTSVHKLEVLSGIPATFEDIKMHASHYHGVVIRIAGVVGTFTYPKRYLYADEQAWRERNLDHAILLGLFFTNEHLEMLQPVYEEGARLQIDGLYQRPYADDPQAPLGQMPVLHQVKKL